MSGLAASLLCCTLIFTTRIAYLTVCRDPAHWMGRRLLSDAGTILLLGLLAAALLPLAARSDGRFVVDWMRGALSDDVTQLLLFIAVGFAAQIVDGAIGMAYGVTATTTLLSLGIPPAIASASTHAAEVFTTGASGFAHWRFGNIDWGLIRRLAVPGMIGGATGAYVLSSLPGETIRPVVSLYLVAMGGIVLWKAMRPAPSDDRPPRHVSTLGLTGGFLDAVGGGGWGPIVTSTLVGQGAKPRYAIGSTNLSEFFVTLTITGTFVTTIGLELWPIIAGLILGGVLAAPFAAYATQKLPDRPLMVLVAVVIILLSLRSAIDGVSGLLAG
jgi:uncharacterized membrane protein YfcA